MMQYFTNPVKKKNNTIKFQQGIIYGCTNAFVAVTNSESLFSCAFCLIPIAVSIYCIEKFINS